MPRSKEKSEQIRIQSRAQILLAARLIFSERGYDGCKVADIAKRANMSQGNIYWYFSSKEEMLKSILADGFETLGTLMHKAATSQTTAHEKIDFLIRQYTAFGRELGDFTNIFLALLAQGGLERLRELGFDTVQIGTGYHQSVSAIFAQGQAEGFIRKDLDANMLTMFFFSFYNGMTMTYGKEWINLPIDEIYAAVLRLIGRITG